MRSLRKFLGIFFYGFIGALGSWILFKNGERDVIETRDKLKEFYLLQNEWIRIHHQGNTLADYFRKNEYKTVAIYGMKELGELLYEELKNSEIEVKYVIDKNAPSINLDVKVVKPDEELEPVDVIIVTAIHYFDEIDDFLYEKVDYPVFSLEDVVYEL